MPSSPSQSSYLQTGGDLSLPGLLERIEELEEKVNEKAFPAFDIQTSVATAEFPGGSPNSNIVSVPFPTEAKLVVQLSALAIESAGNARFVYIVGVTVKGFEAQMFSAVGNPPAGTKENFYWFAFTK